MADSDKKELESFLSKVEEIESIVKGLNSSEDETVKEAVKKADDKIAALRATAQSAESRDGTITGFNKTMINSSKQERAELSDPAIQSGMSQAAFMHAMEEDARQRAERRKVNQKEADVIKEEGNSLFKKGEYLQAVELYSKALRLVPDSHILYTNRAQARIKLRQYDEALSDCDWALRAFPNCTKAFVHQGRAYVALGKYSEARESYQQGLQTDPTKEKIFTEYLAEVERCEQAELEEARAREWSESGAETATGLTGVLTKLTASAGQLPLFYSGGFRVLASLLTGVTEKTLFRTEGGLRLHVDHPVLSRCLSACPKSLSQEELDLLSSAVDLYSRACTDNEVNQEHALETGELPSQLMVFLSAKLRGHGHHLKQSIVAFLHCLSVSSVGRHKIVTLFPLSQLTNWAIAVSQSDVPLAVSILAVINNLALHDSFRKQMRGVLEDQLLPAFISLLTEARGKTLAVLPPSIHMMVNLCGDAVIRSRLKGRDELWKTCLALLKRLSSCHSQPLNGEICGATLALLVNLSCETSSALSSHAHDCCVTALTLTLPPCPADVAEQSIRLVSLCLPHSAESVHWLVDSGHLATLHRSIQSDSVGLVKSAMKCLTVCTQSSERARTFVVDNNAIPTLTGLLENKDEAVVGNAALCLSHCVENPSVCASLADTNIVQTLLVLARDGRKPALQANCGILLARLAKGDNRHLERLRDLHGIEILHQTCGKHLK